MNAAIHSYKHSKIDRINTGFILVCLAFIAGVLIFRISGLNVFSHAGESVFAVLTLGCIFLLLLPSLASASGLGCLLIPVYSLACGYHISAFSGFIIPHFSDATPLIIPCILLAAAYVYVFAFLFASLTAWYSSALIFKRIFSDAKTRAGFVRSAAAILTAAVLIAVLFAFLSKYIFDTQFL